MTVYRFQTTYGYGAYRNHTNHDGDYGYNCQFRRPSPDNDPRLIKQWSIRDCNREWLFGFKSIKQANQWFSNKDQAKMKMFGIELYKIEIKKDFVMVGTKQIAYIEDKVLSCKRVRGAYNDDSIT